jgi:hypothetical protein
LRKLKSASEIFQLNPSQLFGIYLWQLWQLKE